MGDPLERGCWPPPNLERISFGGERVCHLYPNDCYYAHLSIYHFALQFAQDGVVLDAGSGAGYGSAYPADRGARFVWGVDVSPQAVAFSQHYLQRPNLRFQVIDLQEISGLQSHGFDLVISSNVLEHVPDVAACLRAVWGLLKRDGVLLVAVPPVTDKKSRAANLANPYHLNIWTPRQWYRVISHYFQRIDCYRHGLQKPGIELNFANAPSETVISEKDFGFEPVMLDQFFGVSTLSVVFVAREPFIAGELPSPEHSLGFVDDSFTRPFASLHDKPACANGSAIRPALRSLALTQSHFLERAWAFVRCDPFCAWMWRMASRARRMIAGERQHDTE